MAEASVRLEDLHDAVPKFRAAADDINLVISTVNDVLSDVEDIIGPQQYTSAEFEYPVIALADALDRAIKDYEEALKAPVSDFPYPPGWPVGPNGQPLPYPDPDVPYPYPDPKPPKPPQSPHDDGEDDDHASSDGAMPPVSSGTANDDENVPPDDEQQNGGSSGSNEQNQSQTGTGTGTGTGQSGSGNQSETEGGTGAGGATGGILGAVICALGLNKKSEDEEVEEEEEVEEYVSAQNAPVKQELDEKTALLTETETRIAQLQGDREDKAAMLDRLQATAAANPDADSELGERIDQLKKELTEIDSELYYGNEDIPRLREEIEALQKRLDTFLFGPDADIDAVRALEGGETSQWIRDATHNEDNSVNCVNYVVNRMPIPPELPFNAHLWDEQVVKYGPKYGITIGEVPLEGSVIVMEREHSYANDIYGHVMYVERVDENGVVWVTDNNYMDKPVRLDELTGELSGPYIHYLYFPYQTKI